MKWLTRASERAKEVGAIWPIALALLIAVWWLGSDKIRETLRDFLAGDQAKQCVIIPPSGHVIEGARPGGWATVTWHNINRISDCGTPDLTGLVVNGDGIYHDVLLSTSGVKLDIGVTGEIRYRFKIPDNATPGRAWFRVTLDFHEEGRSLNSPRVPFTIVDP